MVAAFRQIFPYAGVDEHIPSGKAGIIVPWKASNVVMLEDGSGLDVRSTSPAAVAADPITDPHYYAALANAEYPGNSVDIMMTMAMLKTGVFRLFKITGHAVVGLDKVTIEAKKPGASKSEATLKVIVVKQKPVTVAIRPVQVLDDSKNKVSFTDGAFDPHKLLAEMNFLWKPQANVVFSLGVTDPALLDSLTPKSEGADIQKPTLLTSLKGKKDTAAALTFFLVRRAFDGNTQVAGVTNASAAVSIIGDDRTDRTMAHEAGHYLGAIGETGHYEQEYGHQGTDVELLMRDHGAGWKIPFGQVTDFNKGYRAS